MPEPTLHAFADHGEVAATLAAGAAGAAQALTDAAAAGIDLADITAGLGREGVQSFCDSYRRLLACIESKLGTVKAVGG